MKIDLVKLEQILKRFYETTKILREKIDKVESTLDEFDEVLKGANKKLKGG